MIDSNSNTTEDTSRFGHENLIEDKSTLDQVTVKLKAIIWSNFNPYTILWTRTQWVNGLNQCKYEDDFGGYNEKLDEINMMA